MVAGFIWRGAALLAVKCIIICSTADVSIAVFGVGIGFLVVLFSSP
jgi:hypothetical protein